MQVEMAGRGLKKGFNGINQVFKNTQGQDAAEGSVASGCTSSQIYLSPSYQFPFCSV